VTPTPTVDCGSAAIGSKAPPKPVTISNIGSLPITVTSIAVGGAGAAQFTVDQPGPLTLPPMSMATVNVTFQPQATGSVQATLTITPMGFVPVTLTLRGNGTGAMVQVAPSTLTFPDTAVGSTSDQQLIGVKNSGQTAVMLQSPSVSDPQFALNLGGFTPMLQAGAQTTFAVTFTPSAASAASAQVSISLAGQNQPVAMVALAGNGIDAGPGGGCTCALARPRRAPLGLGLLALAVVALALRRTRRR
jgi:hypothetical protein